MSVNLDGVKETIRALRKIDPELLKEMNKEIKGIMIPIRDKAREYAPTAAPGGLYNWDDGAKDNQITKRTSAFRESTLGGTTRRLFPLYNAEAARKGIYYSQAPSKRNSSGWSSQYIVANASASGAIYETAGRKNPGGSLKSRSNNPKAGANFISRMGPLYGEDQASRGRMIFRAWYEDQGKAKAAVVRAIENTIAAFNQGRYDKAA
jgi:hypothetical protein